VRDEELELDFGFLRLDELFFFFEELLDFVFLLSRF